MLITFVLTTLLAFVIKGLTGFGPALVMVPVFSYFLPFTEVVPISGALLFFSNLPLAFSGRGQLPKRSFIPAAIGFGVGVALGGNLLVILPEAVLQKILGATLVGFCGYQLWGGRQVDERPLLDRGEQVRLLVVSSLSGLIVGAVGAGALPLIIYLGLRYPKENFRLLLTYVFLVGSASQVAVYSLRGLYTPNVLLWSVGLIVPMFLGLWLGSLFFGRVPQRTFNRVVGILLLAPAVQLLTS